MPFVCLTAQETDMLEHLLKAGDEGATEGGDGARRAGTERKRDAGLEVSLPPRPTARGD